MLNYENCDETKYDENCLITKYIDKNTIGEIVFSNEIVFRGHPDKICDQISAAILKECVRQDSNTRAGIEVMGGKGKIFITGEITTNAKYDIKKIVRDTLKDIGCVDELKYKIIDNLGKQSPDINMGVDRLDNELGAGDNGVMFGYATRETMKLLPLSQVILQEFAIEYDKLVHSGIHYENYGSCFKPDGKAQITGLYSNDFRLKKILAFTICYQNIEKSQSREIADNMLKQIAKNICDKYNIVIDRFLINPTGKFEIGSFVGDAGVTGRKIVIDAYQGFANVGGGCVDYDTEYLSLSGWKKIGEYNNEDLVAQWNNGELEFVKPISYINTKAEKMYVIDSPYSISMVLSENHNVLYRTSKNNFIKKSLKIILDEFKRDSGTRAEIPLWFNNNFIYNSGICLTDDEIKLQVAFCADGSILSSNNWCGRIRVKKEIKKNNLKDLFLKTSIPYKETIDKEYSIFYCNPPIKNKSLRQCFENINRHQAEILSNEIFKWDGNRKNLFRTTKKDDADFIQFVLMGILNKNVSLTYNDRIGKTYHQKYIRKSICYNIKIKNNKYYNGFRKSKSRKTNINIQEFIPKDGKMYCLNVPSHNLILRHNNKVFITGNCMNGKDTSKVDFSGSHKARQLAKRFLMQNDLEWCKVQLSYSIGIAEPMAIYIETNDGIVDTSEMKELYSECKPQNIINDLKLLDIDYVELAKFGHFR